MFNKAFFNKVGKAMNNGNDDVIDQVEEEFGGECAELAEELLIMKNGYIKARPDDFSVFEFYEEFYIPGMKHAKYTVKQLMEKYVVHVLYNGRLNNKFLYKYNAAPHNKLKRLEKIATYMKSPNKWPNGNFNYRDINDPEYYDLAAAQGLSNINWYHNSINNRINRLRTKVKK
jgi:hypothetical protein